MPPLRFTYFSYLFAGLQACLSEQGARKGVLLVREIDARALAVPFDAERAQYAGLAHGGIAVEHVGGMRVQQARIPRRRIGEADPDDLESIAL